MEFGDSSPDRPSRLATGKHQQLIRLDRDYSPFYAAFAFPEQKTASGVHLSREQPVLRSLVVWQGFGYSWSH